jgi:LPXTG-motif cell wall-anchored protein
MRKRTVFRAILGVTVGLAALITAVAPASAWTGAAGQIVIVESWNGHTEILDVEGSDSIENVRQKIYDRTGIDPADTCLIFEGTLMQDGSTLVDYRVDVGDDLNLFLLPVSAAWSITPDDHVVGNTVQNALVTSPAGTGFAVVNGALPAGVTLDEITGIVDGTFTSADPFDVTIRVTTLCGDADLTWASSGATSLPNTGVNIDSGIAAGAGALAATGIGAALLLRRRATRTER